MRFHLDHIDDRTKVPLYAVLACIPFIIGAILWLASIDAKANNAEILGEGTTTRLEKQGLVLRDIKDRLIRIETLLERKHKE